MTSQCLVSIVRVHIGTHSPRVPIWRHTKRSATPTASRRRVSAASLKQAANKLKFMLPGKPHHVSASVALQTLANLGTNAMLNGLQVAVLKRATAAASDALLGPAAPPSQRLLLRRSLRALVAMASLAGLLLKIRGTLDGIIHPHLHIELAQHGLSMLHQDPDATHVDLNLDLNVRGSSRTPSADLVNTVESLPLPPPPSPPPLHEPKPSLPLLLWRGSPTAVAALMELALKLHEASDCVSQLTSGGQVDVMASVEEVLDLASSGPSLLAPFKDLLPNPPQHRHAVKQDRDQESEEDRTERSA